MELGVRKLKLNEATAPIPEGAEDPYQLIQVHDYMSVSFFRLDPNVKSASRETIHVLSVAYPELLSHKYFVNVPAIMGWVFGAMKLFLAPATLRKFHPLTSGTSLANELKPFAATLPKEYGGSGPGVKEGLTVKLTDTPAPAEKAVKAAPAAEPAPTTTEAKPTKPDEILEEAPKEAPKEDTQPAETTQAAVPKAEEPKTEEAATKDAGAEAIEEAAKETKPETKLEAQPKPE
jgi:outer membrane biosynthesis protein TonB